MNWNDPQTQLSLKDLQETLNVRGRDSRVVRGAFWWSTFKKQLLAKLSRRLRRVEPKGAQVRVFFWLSGGLGDAACAKRLVSAYRQLLPTAEFAVYAPLPGVAHLLFGAEKNVQILPTRHINYLSYDLALLAGLSVKFLHADEARLAELAPSFLPVFKQAQAAQQHLGSLLDDPFLTEWPLGRWLQAQGGRRFDLLSYTGGVTLLHDTAERLPADLKALSRWGLAPQQYITFHDGISTAQTVGTTRPTRAWPAAHWRDFLRLFKKEYPHLKVVQLGGKNSPVYPEADVCLVGKTALQDLPALLSGACAHVDTESGLVQLAQYLNVKSVVIFGPTDQKFFGYTKNINLAAGSCGGCMWSTADWMFTCPLGHAEPPCTAAVSVETVLSALRQLLKP